MSISINLVKDGVFPIMFNRDGSSVKKQPETGFNSVGVLQGEGALVGVPSLFIRFSGCNLRCTFNSSVDGKSNLCDTSYSSFTPEINRMKVEDVVELVEANLKNSNCRHVVITGGEPMCQQQPLIELCKQLKDFGLHITLETNGTIFNLEVAKYVDLYSISPKLSNSEPTDDKLNGVYLADNLIEQHKNRRRNIAVIQKFIDCCWESNPSGDYVTRSRDHNFQLKFVVTDPQDISEIQKDFLHHLEGFEASDILLMPEGITSDELKSKSMWVVGECIRNGYRFCNRLHVELFGHLRSV